MYNECNSNKCYVHVAHYLHCNSVPSPAKMLCITVKIHIDLFLYLVMLGLTIAYEVIDRTYDIATLGECMKKILIPSCPNCMTSLMVPISILRPKFRDLWLLLFPCSIH